MCRRDCLYEFARRKPHPCKWPYLFQIPVTLCTLGVGATFGESILQDLPRDSTVITKTTCELLRVEQQDFRLIWEVRTLNLVDCDHRAFRFARFDVERT